MDRVYLRDGGSGAVKQFRRVLVPPTFAQKHAMRMHLDAEHCPPALYDRDVAEEARNAFAAADAGEQVLYSDDPFMEDLKGLDLLDSI